MPFGFHRSRFHRRSKARRLDCATYFETLESRTVLHSALVVSEVMVSPPSPSATELQALPAAAAADFGFIEVFNASLTQTISTLGMRLQGDVEFTFPDATLAPGESAVIVANQLAFSQRYGSTPRVLGTLPASLPPSAVGLTLTDADGHDVVSLQFDLDLLWPARAAGAGASLELIDPVTTLPSQMHKPSRWQASVPFGGTPGGPRLLPSGVVINEVLAGPDPANGKTDQVELLNRSTKAVDLSGWQLTDSLASPGKYTFPAGSVLGSGQFLVLSADELNPTPATPGPQHFHLDVNLGGNLFLVTSDGAGGIGQFVDDLHYEPQQSRVSWGRSGAASSVAGPLIAATWGAANAAAAVDSVVISEVNYYPGPPSPAAVKSDANITSELLEFVEVTNVSLAPRDLAGWQLTGDLDFVFPAETRLLPGESLVILSFDPSSPENADRVDAFQKHYGVGETLTYIGGATGALRNEFGWLRLAAPGVPTAEQPVPGPQWRDEVHYDNRPPWPSEPDGGGQSLMRLSANNSGHDPANWQAGLPTLGEANFASSPQPLLPDLAMWDDPLLGINYLEYFDTHRTTGHKLMRFATAAANIGEGPLIIEGGEVLGTTQRVNQVVYNSDGSTSSYAAGEFVYHPTHNHIHFADYANYRLLDITEDGGVGDLVAAGDKVSFCLIDSAPYDHSLSGYPMIPVFLECDRQTQGISVGWADVYAADLDDQWIDIEHVTPGEYWFETTVDPFNNIVESNETNNVSRHRVVIGAPLHSPDEFDLDGVNDRHLGTGDKQLAALSIHRPGDVDTFRWLAPEDGTLDVSLAFDRNQGDADLYVWTTDSQGSIVLRTAATEASGEHLTTTVTGGKTYFVVIKDLSGHTQPNYALTLDGPEIVPDSSEPNDDVIHLTSLGSGNALLEDRTIHVTGDRDFYHWTADRTGNVLLSLASNPLAGNVNLYVHDFLLHQIAASEANANRDDIELTVQAGQSYLIIVSAADDDLSFNYSLRVDNLSIPPDAWEPNDGLASATDVGSAPFELTNLTIHKPFNSDFYRWTPSLSGTVVADVEFSHLQGNLDLYLWIDGEYTIYSSSLTDLERVTFDAEAGQEYLLEVRGQSAATSEQYRLSVRVAGQPADRFEVNDTLPSATPLGSGSVAVEQLSIHQAADQDFFSWMATARGSTVVDLLFADADGQLSLELGTGDQSIATATPTASGVRLTFEAEASSDYWLQVRGVDGSTQQQYALSIAAPSPPQVAAVRAIKSGEGAVTLDLSAPSPVVPWLDLHRLEFVLTRDVILTADDLTVTDSSFVRHELTGFRYDPQTFTASWAFAGLVPAATLTLELSDRIVDLLGNSLDGESPPSALPSGDGRPGGSYTRSFRVLPGDFTSDQQLSVEDVDALLSGLQSQDEHFDLDANEIVDEDDILLLVTVLAGSAIGDSNFDGQFDSGDLIQIFQIGEFEDQVLGNSTWADGDWTGDGDFNSSDLVFAFQQGGYLP